MLRLLLLPFFMLVLTAAQAQDHSHAPFNGNTDTVFVTGLVKSTFVITAGGANDLPYAAVPAHSLTSAAGEVRKKLGPSKGILLSDVLKKAGTDISRRTQGQYFVVITAADSMQVIFAYNELLYGPASKSAYLVLADGVSGMADDGRFVVLCTGDVATAPRYVKWVRSIELRKI